MMSYNLKVGRKGGEEKWLSEPAPSPHSVREQFQNVPETNGSLFSTQYPPFVSPQYQTNGTSIPYDNEYADLDFYPYEYLPSSSYKPENFAYNQQYHHPGEDDKCIEDFFGESFYGMEETFRSALVQYFSQIDQEKQGLSDDLRKIKDDFCKYEEEGRKFKIDNAQKGKIIRKLTENGKLFVKEIERLKDEIRDIEQDRRHLVADNNELQKRVQHESSAIPHLEKELRSLTDENQYLKLLADDTQKLSQQEKEIEHYSALLEQQQKINQKQESDIKKHEYAVKKLSKINDELCAKISELSKYKDADKKWKALEIKHKQVQKELTEYQAENQQLKEDTERLDQDVQNLDHELNSMTEERNELSRRFTQRNKELHERTRSVNKLEAKLKDAETFHEQDTKDISEYETKCRNLERFNIELQSEVASMKNELNMKQVKEDNLVYEDELRNKEFELLTKKLKQTQKECSDISNTEVENRAEMLQKQAQIDSLTQAKNMLVTRMTNLEKEVKETNDNFERSELKCDQQATRVQQLENEILSHVKTTSEMEQEIALTYNTLDTLRKSNEVCEQQRIKLQQELLFAQNSMSTLKKDTVSQNDSDIPAHSNTDECNSRTLEYEMLQTKYEACENQKNRLQMDILTMQERVNQYENSKTGSVTMDNQLEECKQNCKILERQLNDANLLKNQYLDKYKKVQKQLTEVQSQLQMEDVHFDVHCDITEQHSSGKNRSVNQMNASNESCEQFKDGDRVDMFNKLKIAQNESINKTKTIDLLESDLKNQEHFIIELTEENKKLQQDIEDIVHEISFLRKSEKGSENVIREKDDLVEEFKESIEQLEEELRQKEKLIQDHDNLIETLKSELDISVSKLREQSTSLQEYEEYAAKLNKKIFEKNNEISDLDIHCQKLQKIVENNRVNLQRLENKNQRQESEILHTHKDKSVSEVQSSSHDDYQQFLKERIGVLEKALLEKDNALKECDKSVACTDAEQVAEQDSDDVVSTELKESAKNHKDNRVKVEELKHQNQLLVEELQDIKSSSRVFLESFDYSFEDDKVVSKRKYQDLSEQIAIKNQQIVDFQEHIALLQDRINFLQPDQNSHDSSFTADSMVGLSSKRASPVKQMLKLPSPNKVKSHERRSSLPPIPGRNKTNTPTLNNRLGSTDKLNVGSRQETPMQDSSMDNSDTLRQKVVKLNSELLQKKMEVVSLKEELKNTKRKQIKAADAYRNVVSQNESLEHNIFENREQIRNVQEKHSSSEFQQKIDTEILKRDFKSMEQDHSHLRQDNIELVNELKLKDAAYMKTQQKLDSCEQEMHRWKNNTQMLQDECQQLTGKVEQLDDEVERKQNKVVELESKLKLSNKEIEALKAKEQACEFKMNELCAEKKEVVTEKGNLETILKEKDVLQDNLTAEKEFALHNTKYLESKTDDLKEKLKQSEEKITQQIFKENESNTQITKLMATKKTLNHEVQRLTKEYSKEQDNNKRLEKLNSEINKENKRLMHELIKLQDRLKVLTEENEARCEKLQQAEKEQFTLDLLLTKTQKSNSELLEANKCYIEELRTTKNKVNQLVQNVEDLSEEKKEVENKLLTTENELHNITVKLGNENQALSQELHESRRMIHELEAILDQGQMDFDEMDAQLEKYRRENVDLDEKLHEVLKDEISLRTEQEGSSRKMSAYLEEIQTLKDEIYSERNEMKIKMNKNEELEAQLRKCKSREECFEDRLRSIENLLQNKEELLANEKRENEKNQNELIKIQSELIETRTIAENLRSDRADKKTTTTEQMKNNEHLKISEAKLTHEIELLHQKQKEKDAILRETEERINKYKDDTVAFENQYHENLQQILKLESTVESEKMERTKERKTLENTVSELRMEINKKQIMDDENAQQQHNNDVKLKEFHEENNKLKTTMKIMESEFTKEKANLMATINDLEDRVHHLDYNQSQEMIHIQATMDALESKRGHDISLLRLKLQEVDELRKKSKEEKQVMSPKEDELESLKDDIVQLQTELSHTERKNTNLHSEVESKSRQIQALEANKLQLLQKVDQKNQLESKELENLLADNEQMKKSYETLLQERAEQCNVLENEVTSLRRHMQNVEVVQTENENLKSDLDAMLDERRGAQSKISENVHLRNENNDLRVKANRVQELSNENRSLKQELRDVDSKHHNNIEMLRRENASLKRNADDLFKKNQDLELKNVTYVTARPRSTLYVEPVQPKRDSVTLTIQPKSASFDNLKDVGVEFDSFSPLKHGLSTSTPTHENSRMSTTVMTRAPSVDQLNSVKINSAMSPRKLNTSLDSARSLQGIRDIQVATSPLVPFQGTTQNKNKADASWHYPQQDEQTKSLVKSNPFVQMDQQTAKANWKNIANVSKVTVSAPKSPNKPRPLAKVTNNVHRFDMRPQSADIIEDEEKEDTKTPSFQSLGIGNEFVNRLKATFENR